MTTIMIQNTDYYLFTSYEIFPHDYCISKHHIADGTF